MVELIGLSVPFEYKEADLPKIIARALGVSVRDVKEIEIKKRSIDARKGLKYVMSFWVRVSDESAVKTGPSVKLASKRSEYRLPTRSQGNTEKVVVVGAGPAGLFCALSLASAGYNPLVVERGKSVDARTEDVEKFFAGGRLDPNSNVQFGEGGAGTFSDGKLNTGINDERIAFVLKTFVECGAKEEILYDAQPHVGTDKLKEVVKALRQRIISLGGAFSFSTTMTDVVTDPSGRVRAIELNKDGATEIIPVDVVVLATGHSARDTYQMMDERGVFLEPKPFSIGVRIEHLQEKINEARYHRPDVTASYKLSHRLKSGRGVYTFCMCPGGYVVNSSSEEGHLVVNGMSKSARDGKNANSAILVSVTPEDYPEGSLGGMALQRGIEKRAFDLSKDYRAPAQLFADFCKGRPSKQFGSVQPTISPNPVMADLNTLLPRYVCNGIKEGIVEFGKKVRGFDDGEAVLTGVETRSSSPVRVTRTDSGECLLNPGLFPVGEGAGYAGGITSSAVDGLIAAEKIIARLRG